MAAARRRGINRSNHKGISYARYSSEKQGSIGEQEGVNREVALDNAVELVGFYSDPDISRDLSDRPGLNEMIAFLEANEEVGFIVVNELERLTAGVSQRSAIVTLCQRLRITILTEDMGAIDPFDDDKMQEADQRAVNAKGEVLKVRRRTRRNLRQKVINGTVAMRPAFGTRMKPLVLSDGTVLPSGSKYVDSSGRTVRSGELEVHHDEMPWLLKMFEWADEGVSCEQIAVRLTNAGVKTKSGNDSWRGTSVRGILTNPLYKGEMIWGKRAVKRFGDGTKYLEERRVGDPGRVTRPSPLGAIIDPDLWERVNSRSKSSAVGGQTQRQYQRRNYGVQLFDGYIYCGRCGHKMYGANDAAGERDSHRPKVIWRYKCYSNRIGYEPLPGWGVVCDKVYSMQEKKILAALATLGSADALVSVRPTIDFDSAVQRRRIEKELETLDAEYERGARLVVRGSISEMLWEGEMLPDIDRKRAALTDQLAHIEDRPEPVDLHQLASADFGQLASLLADQNLPVELRRAAIDNAGIVRIYVDSPRIELRIEPSLD